MFRLSSFRIVLSVALLGAFLAGCGKPEVARGINDPYESQNRAVHEANKAIDRAVLRPLSNATGGGEPGPVGRSVSNFAGNLLLPRYVVNDLFQGNIDDAAANFTRLLINTTFGIGGVFDPAGDWGLPERPSDFGETLHVWGATEGHYVELPLAGPSTKRDTIGKVVDLFLNPLSYVLPAPERYVSVVAGAASRLGDRGRFSESVDSVLYDSADSYAQTRLLYLQNRRFQLGQEAETEIDPFALDTEGF